MAEDLDFSPDQDGFIKARIRLDFKGKGRSGRLFGNRSHETAAEEAREHNASLFRNIPIQGVTIEEMDLSGAVYTIFDDITSTEIAYAPVIIKLQADSLDVLLPFITREEFRKIEILEPASLCLGKHGLERLLFRLAEETMNYRQYLERKYSQR